MYVHISWADVCIFHASVQDQLAIIQIICQMQMKMILTDLHNIFIYVTCVYIIYIVYMFCRNPCNWCQSNSDPYMSPWHSCPGIASFSETLGPWHVLAVLVQSSMKSPNFGRIYFRKAAQIKTVRIYTIRPMAAHLRATFALCLSWAIVFASWRQTWRTSHQLWQLAKHISGFSGDRFCRPFQRNSDYCRLKAFLTALFPLRSSLVLSVSWFCLSTEWRALRSFLHTEHAARLGTYPDPIKLQKLAIVQNFK